MSFPAPPKPVIDSLSGKRIVLIIGGGIAAYKCLDLIRHLKRSGAAVRAVMTWASQHFITPLSVGALTADKVFTELFDREDEQDVGHIRLAREADLIVVAPATADLMAKMAHGMANDLATAVLLAARAPILVAPAMNPAMWANPATMRNAARLKADGIAFIGPRDGEMAEKGEAGTGRMAEPLDILEAVAAMLSPGEKPLAGRSAIVTSGPTHEPIDPVRYIANRSSGKQGHAVAAALAKLGASVTLVTGPVRIADPGGVRTVHVKTAHEMLTAVEAALPADIGVFVAAVADWRVEHAAGEKMKKGASGPPVLTMAENPDILKTVGHHALRPKVVVGFAAETQDVTRYGAEKLARKNADMIVANDVSPGTGTFGGDDNAVTLITREGAETWPRMGKDAVADRLATLIAKRLSSG
ncbi:MAG: bifunctional phosphopantothenoylcysteine decarboxylase/phosphopantothenate--cysteine ligase CoaBC [Rhizobiaceae bacterium]|nr:bifunctional phosphopantothenoylcysteine decarboxylase/phosphopantothenate--cysteine ligase CoaBC [Rhizobiaceae bacterium]